MSFLICFPLGPVLSTYAVQDKVQVAEIDPSIIIDVFDEESDSQPCPICGDNDNEEALLLCDGCDVPSHTYCVGLDGVPSGHWYCDQCDAQRPIGSVSHSPTRQSNSRPERRTRAQQRRLRSRNQANSLHWARVWQSVWDQLNLDLDFPWDDDLAADRLLQQQRREAAHQREFQAWQRRAQVAERQGGQRFFDPTSILDNYAPRPSRPRVPRAPTPQPESLEEMRAWNAFERARELESDPNAARKRKSPTLSPSPEPTEPERKLKRPRTRRAEELAALAVQNGEASRAARLSADNNPTAPSFLQSLLKEVDDASFSNRNSSIGPSALSSNTPTDHNTPGTSSPSLSPAPSNYSSPRLSSVSPPPPHSRGRPISPVQLISSADLSPPSSPGFSPPISPISPMQDRDMLVDSRPIQLDSRIRGSRSLDRVRGRPVARSVESSPTRAGLSLSVKSDVQRLVGNALRPFYRRKVVSKDEYTDINRTVSRMFYEQIGEAEALDADRKTQLQVVADEEVKKAVEALQRGKDKSSSHDQRP